MRVIQKLVDRCSLFFTRQRCERRGLDAASCEPQHLRRAWASRLCVYWGLWQLTSSGRVPSGSASALLVAGDLVLLKSLGLSQVTCHALVHQLAAKVTQHPMTRKIGLPNI
jgi:hypothetical protein